MLTYRNVAMAVLAFGASCQSKFSLKMLQGGQPRMPVRPGEALEYAR